MRRIYAHLSRQTSRSRHKLRKLSGLPPRAPKRLELRVPMCCEWCEENVRQVLTELGAVKEINFDVPKQKVVILGFSDEPLEAELVLAAVKKVKHRAELWT